MLRRLSILLSLFLVSCANNSCEADGAYDPDSQNQTELITSNADLGTMHSDSLKTSTSDILVYNYPGLDNSSLSYYERGLFWFNVPDGTQSKKIRFLYIPNGSVPIFLADDSSESLETCQENLNLLESSFTMSCNELAKELGWVIQASGAQVDDLLPHRSYEELALYLLQNRDDIFYYSCSVLGSANSTVSNIIIESDSSLPKLKCN